MCGLVGIIGDIGYTEKRVFKDLLMLDYIRGPHSTGVAAIGSSGEFKVAKRVGSPAELFDTKSYDDALNPITLKALLGHNRYATKGKISSANAHPFEFSDVVGCHNGTLSSFTNLDDHLMFEVDSEALMNHVNNHGVNATLPLLRGAYALTIWDKRESAVTLARNNDRPLYYAFAADMETMFYASEEWMLEVALEKHSVAYTDIIEVKAGYTYKFSPTGKYKEKLKATIRKFDMYVAPVVTYTKPNQSAHSNFNHPLHKKVNTTIEFEVSCVQKTTYGVEYLHCVMKGVENAHVRVWAKNNPTLWAKLIASPNFFKARCTGVCLSGPNFLNVDNSSIEEIASLEAEEVDSTEFYGFQDEELTEGQWKHHTRHGCSHCKIKAEVIDRDDLMWLSRESFLCPVCQDMDYVEMDKAVRYQQAREAF